MRSDASHISRELDVLMPRLAVQHSVMPDELAANRTDSQV